MTTAIIRLWDNLDIAEWERRYSAGEVPSRWPFGLDLLQSYGVEPIYVSGPARKESISARVFRKFTGFDMLETVRSPSRIGELLLCWNEDTGIPELLRRERNQRPVATGIHWLTEAKQSIARFHSAKHALRKSEKVWVHSVAQLPVLESRFGLKDRQLAYLPFGVDADFFTPATDSGNSDPQLVVSVGNDRHRDFATLMTAVETTKRATKVRLEIATRRRVAVDPDLGLRHENLPHYLLRELYGRAAVVAIATEQNLHCSGITTFLEAMACGKAVVATDTPGVREYIANNETGLLVPPGRPDMMADAITELLRNPAKAREFGLAGRKAVEKKFNTNQMMSALASIIT